jgi:hypothetical protein
MFRHLLLFSPLYTSSALRLAEWLDRYNATLQKSTVPALSSNADACDGVKDFSVGGLPQEQYEYWRCTNGNVGPGKLYTSQTVSYTMTSPYPNPPLYSVCVADSCDINSKKTSCLNTGDVFSSPTFSSPTYTCFSTNCCVLVLCLGAYEGGICGWNNKGSTLTTNFGLNTRAWTVVGITLACVAVALMPILFFLWRFSRKRWSSGEYIPMEDNTNAALLSTAVIPSQQVPTRFTASYQTAYQASA